jgi:hypothetical protein
MITGKMYLTIGKKELRRYDPEQSFRTPIQFGVVCFPQFPPGGRLLSAVLAFRPSIPKLCFGSCEMQSRDAIRNGERHRNGLRIAY